MLISVREAGLLEPVELLVVGLQDNNAETDTAPEIRAAPIRA